MKIRSYSVALVALTLALAQQSARAISASVLQDSTFTPATDVDRAKLSNTLWFYDTQPNHSGSATVSIVNSFTLQHFLLENDAYYLDFTLRLQNNQGVPPPGLPVRLVSITLLNPIGEEVSSTDVQYFLSGTGTESTSFFNDPPGEDGAPPEALSWDDGVLPAGNPYVEGVFSATLRLDPTVNFGGDLGNLDFLYRVDWQTISDVPEAEAVLPLAAAAASCLLWRRRRRS